MADEVTALPRDAELDRGGAHCSRPSHEIDELTLPAPCWRCIVRELPGLRAALDSALPSLFISVSTHPPDRVVDGILIYLESRHGCCGRNRFLGQLTRLGSRRLCLDSSSFVRLTRCGQTASTPSRTTPRRCQRRAGSTSSPNLLGSTGQPLFTDRFGHAQQRWAEGSASA